MTKNLQFNGYDLMISISLINTKCDRIYNLQVIIEKNTHFLKTKVRYGRDIRYLSIEIFHIYNTLSILYVWVKL